MAPSTLFLLCFSIFLTLLFPSSSSSPSSSKQLLLPMTHSLSKAQFISTHHLLKTTAAMSSARHRHHGHHKSHRSSNQQVSLPLSPGSDYTLTFTLKSQTISVYMDTGSDVVWFPCSPFECILCEGKYEPGTLTPLNVSKTSVLPCKSRACSAAHSSLSSSDLCAMANCPLEDIETSDCANFACPAFYFAYGDGSLIAQLHKEDITMPSNSNQPLILKNFTFGCAHRTLGEPVGVAGFGRGSLSLPAQLADLSPELGTQFSYCLVSHSFDSTKLRHPSPLILGKYKEKRTFEKDSEFVYTPMLDNPKHPYFYSVGLEAISVGSRRIPAPENLRRVDGKGNGGVVVDSGTTYTMLPTDLYDAVVGELDRRVGRVMKRAKETESRTGMSPCYYLRGGMDTGRVVPGLSLHFGGNSSVALPTRNYFYEFMDGGEGRRKGRRVGCLMMMDAGEWAESGPGATLGNYQQQGFEVVYDLEERRVGFAPRECASLWENLTQG